MKAVSNAMIYLENHHLFTLEHLDAALQNVNARAQAIHSDMKQSERRMRAITGIQKAVETCQSTKAVHDKYLRIGWKARQAAFAEAHKDELNSFNKAYRYLKKQGVDLTVDIQALQAEYTALQSTHTELAAQLAAVRAELKPLKDIRYWVSKVLVPEQHTVEQKAEPKHSVKEQIAYLQEQEEQNRKKRKAQQYHMEH